MSVLTEIFAILDRLTDEVEKAELEKYIKELVAEIDRVNRVNDHLVKIINQLKNRS